MNILSVLFAILVFSFLIFIHELGHFTMAKLFGVQVNEFSMFMGPVLWKKQKGETLYSLRLIPIGGFCAMEGEDGDSDSPRSFTQAAWWKRMLILVAGAAMNFVAGVALFVVVFSARDNLIMPVVDAVEPTSALAAREDAPGLMAGDTILELDGKTIYNYSDFELILMLGSDAEKNPENRHDLVLLRDGTRVELNNFAMEKRPFEEDDGSVVMRYGFTFGTVEASFSELVKYAWNNSISNVRMVYLSLGMLLSGKAGLNDMSGPVGIVQMMSETAVKSGSVYYAFLNMMSFGGMIAVNLAVMNLLPIPALDGGRAVGVLVTAVVEGITRKKINPKYEGYIHGVGMIAVLALMGILVFKDIFMIFKG